MNRLLAVLLMTVVTAAACSSTPEKPDRLCPQTAVVRDLERVRDYGNDMPDRTTLVSTGLMKTVKGSCDYRDDGVDVNFNLTIVAERGPRLGGKSVNFPFFVSVLDPNQTILTKELMTSIAKFHDDDKVTEKIEEMHIFIPMDKDADGTNYQVLMGFQLSEDQLKMNRKESAKGGS